MLYTSIPCKMASTYVHTVEQHNPTDYQATDRLCRMKHQATLITTQMSLKYIRTYVYVPATYTRHVLP